MIIFLLALSTSKNINGLQYLSKTTNKISLIIIVSVPYVYFPFYYLYFYFACVLNNYNSVSVHFASCLKKFLQESASAQKKLK